jgi:peptide/nickel transport system permease protein
LLAYISRRLLIGVVSLFGVSIISFTLTRIIPSDPADMWMGPRATPEQIARTTVELGLDKPIPVQYIKYMSGFLRGDWGISIVTKQPVLRDIGRYLPASLELIIFGMFLGFAVGIPLGVLTAAKSGSGVDHVSRLMSITGVALPSFWLAMILQLVFAKILSIFPLSGRLDFMVEIENPVSHITGFFVVDSLVTGNWTALRDALTHIILPGITLAVYPLGLSARLVRTTMLEVLGEDFIRTARASGLGEIKVLTVYALRNALGPIITVAVLTFGYSLVSTFLIESLFAWPGLGRYSAKAIVSVDYPAIMGVTLLIATFYTILNLLADLLQAFMDPRIRLS